MLGSGFVHDLDEAPREVLDLCIELPLPAFRQLGCSLFFFQNRGLLGCATPACQRDDTCAGSPNANGTALKRRPRTVENHGGGDRSCPAPCMARCVGPSSSPAAASRAGSTRSAPSWRSTPSSGTPPFGTST